MLQDRAPEPRGEDWKSWARRLVQYLSRVRSFLVHQTGDESAAEDGVIMWDRANVRPVVSRNGAYDEVLVNKATTVQFNTTTSPTPIEGQLSWNQAEGTLNLGHADGVVQQIGFGTYMYVQNNTGSTIANGTVVGFSSVGTEIEIAPYIADGTFPALYFIGVATHDMPNGDTGPVTIYGKVRDFDTSMWSVGTILYASPSTAGAFTSTRPTAPNEVVVIAAVLVSDATNGEIMVRPTIPIGLDYAQYTSTVDQTLSAANTPTAVTFNTTDVQHGISLVSSSQITAAQSGLYAVSISLQVTSSNSSSSTAYAWLRKNGTDVARTGLDFTIKANGDTKVLASTYQVSLQAGDYIQIMWAGSTTNLKLDNIPIKAFMPITPSAIVSITQIQL